MKLQPFINKPIGGLNLTANPNAIPPKDFIDGYDIVDSNPKMVGEDGYAQPNNNTKLAYDLGSAEATIKKYRVEMDLTDLTDCNLLFNFEVIGMYQASLPVAYTSGQSAATALAAIQAAFLANGYLSTTSITAVTASGFLLSFDIEIPYYGYTDYFLTVTNSLDGVYFSEALLDAISVDKAGIFYPSCFANINNDQQIFATSNTKKPESLVATISTSVLGGFLTFSVDPLIYDGEEVYINPQVGGFNQIAGVYTLVSAGGGNYRIIASINPILGTIPPFSGDYTVVRNSRSLSVIGYATKNDIVGVWSYTELLRSNKMNFRLYKQIQGALNVTTGGLLYDFTDFLNPIKRLIYKGDIVTGGFLSLYNSEAIYSLDTIDVASRLQTGANTSKVTLAVASGVGAGGRTGFTNGAKRESCYTAFVRFRASDGAYTPYSKASNVLWLHSSSVTDHNYGLNSGRAIQITIEQVPLGLYESVEVGVIEFTTSSWIGYSLPAVQINGDKTVYIGDSGFNTESYSSFNDAATLLEQIPFVFENSKTILGYNNYLLAGNVNLYQEYDLTDWAQDIALTVVRREIIIDNYNNAVKPENTALYFLGGINTYTRCSNEWMSYMPHDHYRFCVFIDWENGSPTSTYWIDDVSFAPFDTGLTDDVCAVSGSDLVVYQYYLEATNINTGYVLSNGKLLKDEIKDIRFGRALCNNSVQTTGIGVAVVLDGTDNIVSSFDNDTGGMSIIGTKLALYSPDYQNTGNIFNWQAGDILRASQAWLGDVAFYTTANHGYSFNRNAAAQTALGVVSLINSNIGGVNDIALFKYNNGGDIYIRNGAAVTLAGSLDYSNMTNGYVCQNFYYIRQYGAGGAYPSPPQQTRFFVIPQNKWYNKGTHNSSTVYEIYGGDCFPTMSAYKIGENETDPLSVNNAITFYSFNRTNTALRSGSFPHVELKTYLTGKFLTESYFTQFPFDQYTYDACFTPRYLFQNQAAFNPLLPQLTNKFSSLFYSNQGFGSDLAGGNRVWLPLDMKTLESKYGAITHFDTLLGQTGTNILIVWQERRVTAQYFDNTANIVSNSGQLLIGTGEILGRQGQDFTEFGCEHKWLIKKGQTITGKDVAYWICFRKTSVMRFGADGTSNIIGNIAPLIENKTILALFNGYNNEDEPALFNGCHAVWDNKRMEYIVTLRLYPKCVPFAQFESQKGDFKADPNLKWGFEQFPVMYKSLKDTNDDPVTDPTAWTTYDSYDSDYFEILTLVWNEKDNSFKSFRSHSPKIYGQFNDNIVSSHPVFGNLIYEHNDILNEALYYGVETKTIITATTDPLLFRINGAGIETTFPSPFVIEERTKYVVTINGKNYEVVGTGTDYLEMANVDNDVDDILPQVTIPNFSYSVCNSQDPYITTVASNGGGRYFHFGRKLVQSDYILKRTEYEAGYSSFATPTTRSFTNKSEEVFNNGVAEVQIRQDTTNSPTNNKVGLNNVEGLWAKVKNILRWGKKNRVEAIEIHALETEKTK